MSSILSYLHTTERRGSYLNRTSLKMRVGSSEVLSQVISRRLDLDQPRCRKTDSELTSVNSGECHEPILGV